MFPDNEDSLCRRLDNAGAAFAALRDPVDCFRLNIAHLANVRTFHLERKEQAFNAADQIRNAGRLKRPAVYFHPPPADLALEAITDRTLQA